tara:strand:+ start:104 stop:397 length:294 start_codon:yes stop_codon:yes gene_type:complete
MKLEVKEIKLDANEVYCVNSYPSDGVFLAFDGCNHQFMFILKSTSLCMFLCYKNDIQFLESPEQEANDNISQDLFLKTLSLVVNKDESYKQSAYEIK